jgi:hypothetical protein
MAEVDSKGPEKKKGTQSPREAAEQERQVGERDARRDSDAYGPGVRPPEPPDPSRQGPSR